MAPRNIPCIYVELTFTKLQVRRYLQQNLDTGSRRRRDNRRYERRLHRGYDHRQGLAAVCSATIRSNCIEPHSRNHIAKWSISLSPNLHLLEHVFLRGDAARRKAKQIFSNRDEQWSSAGKPIRAFLCKHNGIQLRKRHRFRKHDFLSPAYRRLHRAPSDQCHGAVSHRRCVDWWNRQPRW